jgi:hypothetical protein
MAIAAAPATIGDAIEVPWMGVPLAFDARPELVNFEGMVYFLKSSSIAVVIAFSSDSEETEAAY